MVSIGHNKRPNINQNLLSSGSKTLKEMKKQIGYIRINKKYRCVLLHNNIIPSTNGESYQFLVICLLKLGKLKKSKVRTKLEYVIFLNNPNRKMIYADRLWMRD